MFTTNSKHTLTSRARCLPVCYDLTAQFKRFEFAHVGRRNACKQRFVHFVNLCSNLQLWFQFNIQCDRFNFLPCPSYWFSEHKRNFFLPMGSAAFSRRLEKWAELPCERRPALHQSIPKRPPRNSRA